jgi:hypothetical protein
MSLHMRIGAWMMGPIEPQVFALVVARAVGQVQELAGIIVDIV